MGVGGWRRLAVGGGWRLAVGGPWGLSLRAVRNKRKKSGLLQDSPALKTQFPHEINPPQEPPPLYGRWGWKCIHHHDKPESKAIQYATQKKPIHPSPRTATQAGAGPAGLNSRVKVREGLDRGGGLKGRGGGIWLGPPPPRVPLWSP